MTDVGSNINAERKNTETVVVVKVGDEARFGVKRNVQKGLTEFKLT